MVRCPYTSIVGNSAAGCQPAEGTIPTGARDCVMQLRWWPSAFIALLVLLAFPAISYASVGVGIQAGPVRLAGGAHPGGSYALPPVYVVNTGSQSESVTVRIERISPGVGRTVPPAWISASGQPVSLSHNQSARIPLQLTVPASARPGSYFSDVVVHGSAAISVGSANMAVAAATKIEFRIVPGVVSGSWLGLPGWLLPAIAGLAVLVVVIVVVRRSGVRIRIERTPAGTS